jgi:WD40 repeat protein
VGQLTGHTQDVLDLALLHDGRIVSASADASLRVWDPEKTRSDEILKGHTADVSCVEALPPPTPGPDARRVVFWRRVRSVQMIPLLWEVLPDGRVVSGSWDTKIILWHGGTQVGELRGHTSKIHCLAFFEVDLQCASFSSCCCLTPPNPPTTLPLCPQCSTKSSKAKKRETEKRESRRAARSSAEARVRA